MPKVNPTNKLAYMRHAYSGPRKSRKKVQATLKRLHGNSSDNFYRLEAWRNKAQKKLEQTTGCPIMDSPHTTHGDNQLPNLSTAQDMPKIITYSRAIPKIAKGAALLKNELALLVNLIEENKIITSKAINASNNRLKDIAWSKITDAFNASICSFPRKVEQLRLEWENLKKVARNRMNNIKTGGSKPDYIPPDETLDKVASILGITCDGFPVSYGGDAEVIEKTEYDIAGEVISEDFVDDESNSAISESNSDDPLLLPLPSDVEPITKKFSFKTPSGNRIAKQKRKLLDEDIKARIARNKAIGEYYDLKKKKLLLEIENKELINKKIKLELEQINM